MPAAAGTIRLAELLGALSLATDLANGQAAETGLRTTLLACRLVPDASPADRRDTYWAGLLRYLGCSGFAVEEAGFAAGDDIGLRRSFARTDLGRPAQFVRAVLRDVGRGAPPLQRVRGVTRLLATPGAPRAHALAQCDAGLHCARKLAMSPGVLQALADSDERYDGSGLPQGKAADALNLPLRAVEVARVAVIFLGLGGLPAARAELRRRAGGHLDPALVRRFDDDAEALCVGLLDGSPWDAFLAAEPGLWLVDAPAMGRLFDAFALMADLKSGFFAGHSQGVAALARGAARAAGADQALAERLGHAGLLHDLGRVAVPGGLWDKAGPLNPAEWERVRLHSYYSDRVLRRSPQLRELAELAGRAHERCDGSGYPRGEADAGSPAGWLAAADVFHACLEPRAHRPALSVDAARRVLVEHAAAGRLARGAVDAVLAAAGQPELPSPAPGPLTPRELQVLRLLVQGLSNKAIARELGISPRTVQHHSIHIYGKTGVRSRAGAALWAVEQGLYRPLQGGAAP